VCVSPAWKMEREKGNTKWKKKKKKKKRRAKGTAG
jgi:hypothetical protein